MVEDYGWIRPGRRQRAGSLLWGVVALVFGWTVFAYWWGKVLGEDDARVLPQLLTDMALLVLALLGGTVLWIRHNKRLARRGSRGDASPYRVASFEADSLGRALRMPPLETLQSATVVVIDATGEVKTYASVE